jgi:hypothetical protein
MPGSRVPIISRNELQDKEVGLLLVGFKQESDSNFIKQLYLEVGKNTEVRSIFPNDFNYLLL